MAYWLMKTEPEEYSFQKENPIFSGWALVRLPRLSVMPVAPEYWEEIHRMSEK